MDPRTCNPFPVHPSTSISGGDTRLINYDPDAALRMFYQTGTIRHQRTDLVDAFFGRENVSHLLDKLERALQQALESETPTRVAFNDEFVHTMWEVARDNMGLAYVPGALNVLNRLVIDHEFNVHYHSFLRRKLWIKYYLEQDRMRVFPHGELTKGTRGERTVSVSGYMLSNPWANHRTCYLRDAEGLRPCSGGAYEPIPGHLQPPAPTLKRSNARGRLAPAPSTRAAESHAPLI